MAYYVDKDITYGVSATSGITVNHNKHNKLIMRNR